MDPLSNQGMRTPFAVIAVLLVLLVGLGFAFEDEDTTPEPQPAAASVDTIARRVEALRHLRFKELPKPVEVTPAQAKREGLEDVDRSYPPERRRADEAVYKTLGLIAPDADLRQLAGSLFEEGVAGYYDPRDGRLRVVSGAGNRNRVVGEITLAHELTHALEDQRFNLHLGRLTAPTESAEVRRAVTEGTATFVQDLYRHRYLHDNVPVGRRIDSMRSVIGAQQTPYAINAEAIFDYVEGGLFVRHLYRQTDDFSVVNRVLRHPPRRSDQILHPHTWPGGGADTRVRLGAAKLLGPSWRRVGGGTAGEERALAILLAGAFGTQANLGASGWAGGRFAVWRPRGAACPDDCVDGSAGVIAFRWRHHDDAEQFAIGVPAYMTLGLLAGNIRPSRLWQVGDGYAALGTAARASALAFAPRRELALDLSRRAAAVAERGNR
jgi:hypothetical protein